ncbi:MAG: hypothetical protein A2X81_18145 [Desulfobacterales bacterium GWB2_56_26]|nr:MAG: hypothetical protein A2X81_18145 [Desulfobacterales bacterium GWB2_56_26]
MINGIHCNSTNMGPISHPPVPSCFAEFLALVLTIPHLPYAGPTVAVEFSNLSRWQTNEYIATFFGHKLCSDTGAAYQLRTLAYFHFNVVNDSTERNVDKRQAVAWLNIHIVSSNNGIADRYSIRRQNISLLTINITQ